MSIQPLAVSNSRISLVGSGKVSRSQPGFEHSLAHGQLRRVEAKEFLFAEGDAISHVYRIETGALALYKVLAVAGDK
jgi:CRP-like cAMP-binding protein